MTSDTNPFQPPVAAARRQRNTAWPAFALLLACVPLLSACSKSTAPPAASLSAGDGANLLTITTSRKSYTWSEISINGGGLVATVRNPNALDYFSSVGDGFTAGEQDKVFIAMGSDATIELLRMNGTWAEVGTTALLFEGVRVVPLRGGVEYELRGYLTEPRRTGTMRVRLRYSDSPDPGGNLLTDYSAPFTVR